MKCIRFLPRVVTHVRKIYSPFAPGRFVFGLFFPSDGAFLHQSSSLLIVEHGQIGFSRVFSETEILFRTASMSMISTSFTSPTFNTSIGFLI